MIVAWLLACTPAQPLAGPGYDPKEGLLIEADTLVAAVTYAEIARGQRSAFDDHVDAIVEQTEVSGGFVARSLRGELAGREVWTLTVWEDEESMAAFAASDAHLAAMGAAHEVTEQFDAAYWTLDASEMPVSWDDALLRLEE